MVYTSMDDCLAKVAVDFGGAELVVGKPNSGAKTIGKMPTEMFLFLKSFPTKHNAIGYSGDRHNEHHKIEAIFKACAKAVKRRSGAIFQASMPRQKVVKIAIVNIMPECRIGEKLESLNVAPVVSDDAEI